MWKKAIAMLLVVIMVGGAAPIEALAEMDWPTLPDGTVTSWANDGVSAVKSAAAWLGERLHGLSLRASAATYTGTCGANGSNVTWSLDTSTGVLTITGTGAMKNYSFRVVYDYCSSDAPWQLYSVLVKTVKIGNSVTSIGNYAFYNCTSLTSVTIGDSVTSIGYSAFDDCTSLISVMIPDSVTSIGSSAFGDCTSLTSVTIGDSVTNISRWTFNGCTSLTSITVHPDNPAYCSDMYGVLYNKALTMLIQYPGGNSRTSFTIPDSVTSIGMRAFDDCTNLTSMTIPVSMTCISEEAFFGCDSLTSVTIPDSVTSIGSFAFGICTSLTSVTIPDSVTSIGDKAFWWCRSLTSMTIPDSVTSIGDEAFTCCFGLTSVTIPDSVTSIGDYVFFCCTSLASVTIPDSVTSIGADAFSDCTGLTSVTIPDSVTSIGEYAFYDCTSLTDAYYTGSSNQWKKIVIKDGNESLLNATIHFDYHNVQIDNYLSLEQALQLAEIYYGRKVDISDELVRELIGQSKNNDAIRRCFCCYLVQFANLPWEEIEDMVADASNILWKAPLLLSKLLDCLSVATDISDIYDKCRSMDSIESRGLWLDTLPLINTICGTVVDVAGLFFNISLPTFSIYSQVANSAFDLAKVIQDQEFFGQLVLYRVEKQNETVWGADNLDRPTPKTNEQKLILEYFDTTFELHRILERFRGSGSYVPPAVQNSTDSDLNVVVHPNKPSVDPETPAQQVITVPAGETVTLPNEKETGYTFTGWYTDAACTIPAPAEGNQIGVAEGLELYAGWHPVSVYVGYDLNGGAVGAVTGILTHVDVAVYDAGYEVAAVLAEDPPAKTGYSLIGWQEAETATTYSNHQQLSKWTRLCDVIFKALWQANTYTLTFNAAGGICDTETKTVTFDAAYGALPVPQRIGYVFDGWHTEDMTMLNEQSIVRTASDQTLYADWTMLGDVLRDESLDLQDVALLTRHLAGGWDTTGIHVSAGDVNRDGKINLKDAVILRRYLAGGWNVELI